ncbi:MAG: hypothetical protein A2051_10710 [Desulfovibrionales bacterium GWA2_65_9]|nr:MAG: hypothetical protein A2051_10710 [Desulfovibrionales bacterium GWA2_65_9]
MTAHSRPDHTMLARLRRKLAEAAGGDGAGLPAHLGFVTCVSRHRIRNVVLPQPTAVFVLSGEKILHDEDASHTARVGQMLCIPALWRVTVENVPSGNSGRYLALCLSYTPEMLARAALACPQPPCPRRPDPEDIIQHAEPILLQSVEHLLDLCLACPGDTGPSCLALETTLRLLGRRTESRDLLLANRSSSKERLSLQIMAEPDRAWTAQESARRMGLSERGLRRALEAEGTSLRELLRDIRLNLALGLLQQGLLSVGEVALRTGYESPSRFSSRFRERFGVSPRDILHFRGELGEDLAGTGQCVV